MTSNHYLANSQDDLITAPAAADLLDVTRQTMARWCREGKIPSARQMQPGGWWVMRREDVEKLRKERNE